MESFGGTRWGRRLLGSGGMSGLQLDLEGSQESDLALALQGRLQTVLDQRLDALHGAYWRAMDRVVQAGKGRLRADILGGNFHNGAALSKTWQSRTYPRDKNSLDVAGWLYTRSALLIEVFETTTVIRVSGGRKFLAIPLGPAKAIVRRLQREKRKGLRGRNAWGRFEKDDGYVDQVAQALGVNFRPIISVDGQTGVLVADNSLTVTPTGRSAKRQGAAATPLFALTKVATLNRRIKGMALLDEIKAGFSGDFVHALLGEAAVAGQDDTFGGFSA